MKWFLFLCLLGAVGLLGPVALFVVVVCVVLMLLGEI
jgi:hypothetical protein